jgi:UPF0271 protein
MIARVDLNSDMGESFGAWHMGDDSEMLKIVSTANIACGFHGGDPLVMDRTLKLAKRHGVAVGAHPSLYDIWGFGRRPIQGEKPDDIEKMLIYQVGALAAMAAAVGHPITHVKVHGHLGYLVAFEPDVAAAVARAIKAVDPKLVFLTFPATEADRAGDKAGLTVAREVYADRTYDDNGYLTSRKKPGSVIHDVAFAVERVRRMLDEGGITTVTGKKIKVPIDSISVHSDTPAAVEMSRTIRALLVEGGVTIAPFAATPVAAGRRLSRRAEEEPT